MVRCASASDAYVMRYVHLCSLFSLSDYCPPPNHEGADFWEGHLLTQRLTCCSGLPQSLDQERVSRKSSCTARRSRTVELLFKNHNVTLKFKKTLNSNWRFLCPPDCANRLECVKMVPWTDSNVKGTSSWLDAEDRFFLTVDGEQRQKQSHLPCLCPHIFSAFIFQWEFEAYTHHACKSSW